MDFRINAHFFLKLNVSLLIGLILISISLKLIHPILDFKQLIIPYLIYWLGANILFAVVLNLVIYFSLKGKMSNQMQVVILKWLLVFMVLFPMVYFLMSESPKF